MKTILRELIQRYPIAESVRNRYMERVRLAPSLLSSATVCLYLCGNGGSAADAEHIVGELMKSFAMPRGISDEVRGRLDDEVLANKLEGALRALALTGLGQPGDCVCQRRGSGPRVCPAGVRLRPALATCSGASVLPAIRRMSCYAFKVARAKRMAYVRDSPGQRWREHMAALGVTCAYAYRKRKPTRCRNCTCPYTMR